MKHKVENQRTSWAMYLRSALVLILTGTATAAVSQPAFAHTTFDPNSPTEPNTLVAVGNRVCDAVAAIGTSAPFSFPA